jgi:drug/metabolite transporter (DMT)-like permease
VTEQSPVPGSGPLNRHEARRLRREQRLADPSQGSAWIVGTILIVLGGLFLVRTTRIVDIPLTNWWALFILIPAIVALSAAWHTYQAEGRLTGPARGSLLVGLILTFITFMFLFEVSWTYVGPILIIAVGIAIILNYATSNQD